MYLSPISTSWYRRFWSGYIVRNGQWRILNNVFYSRKAYFAHRYKKWLYHPWSYRITINENPVPLMLICKVSDLCLLLTKVLSETSFKSFQYNTKGSRLSNYSIKLILCSHYRSRYKMYEELCQNINHWFGHFAKGGLFCAAHVTLRGEYHPFLFDYDFSLQRKGSFAILRL